MLSKVSGPIKVNWAPRSISLSEPVVFSATVNWRTLSKLFPSITETELNHVESSPVGEFKKFSSQSPKVPDPPGTFTLYAVEEGMPLLSVSGIW